MPIVLAGRRSATAALAQMCVCDLNVGINLRGPRQIPVSTAGQSCPATSATNAFNGVGCHHVARRPHPNPHSARGTTACHFPRFPSLEAFGRRPLASVFAASSVSGRHPKPFTISDIKQPPNRRLTSRFQDRLSSYAHRLMTIGRSRGFCDERLRSPCA
jgi:hypothetical protein